MFFISPPFGNYLNLPYTKAIKGSFTLHERTGLLGQIFKTLRYSNEHNGWINKIGLRNKGIDWAIKNHTPETILSIAILNNSDIDEMVKKLPKNQNIEINISCPNAEKSMIDENIHKFINDKRKWCVIKVSPLVTKGKLDSYYKVGFRQFHVSNTLPTERGGLSGKSLIPYNKESIEYLSKTYSDTEIIGGGGIQNIDDALMYKKFGADHVSVSTLCFNPYKFMKFYNGKF